MPYRTRGLHHVTAIATRPQANAEFYVRTLGLRMVKRTVNFDDPQTYHLYFGDGAGSPGTILTFFPWPGVGPGMRGAGEAVSVSLSVPRGSLGAWRERLERAGVPLEPRTRFGDAVLAFQDPDGLPLELVERDGAAPAPWSGSGIDAWQAVLGLDGVTVRVPDAGASEAFLQQVFGLETLARDDENGRTRTRLAAPDDGSATVGRYVDLLVASEASPGRLGAGSVHHVAFRAEDDAAQAEASAAALAHGSSVTKVKDRLYFRSVYFHEPAGALLEVATDAPGFTVDEPLDELGLGFKLPSWLEEDRQFLRGRLPVLASPEYADRWST